MTIATKETASARARRLMEVVSAASTGHYTKGEVKAMLNAIAQSPDIDADPVPPPAPAELDIGCRGPIAARTIRRGDVFIGSVFGGKVRPWVVLRVAGSAVVAMPLTSSAHDYPGTTPALCRLWRGSSIGSSISTFPLDLALREVTRPYTEARHLRWAEQRAFRLLRTGSAEQAAQPATPE